MKNFFSSYCSSLLRYNTLFCKPTAIKHQGEIADRIVLFTPEGYDPTTTPSLAFVRPLKKKNPLPQNWKLIPQFFSDNKTTKAFLKLPVECCLYATGEVTGPLLRNGKKITFWNTDNLEYKQKDHGRRLYQSHPWVLGVRPDGSAFGVIFDTTWKAHLKTTSRKISFTNEGALFRVLIIERDSPLAVVRALAELTGKMPMPPKWALGFQQCRYSYYPDTKVREIADEYRKRRLPCDVIWMDIHYMDGYRIFTFDPQRFPDPKATNDYLHQHGFHSVWMIDPGVKVDPNYKIYQSGSQHDVWVKTKEGNEYHGEVWPGLCTFPDFTMPAVRQWWSHLYTDFMAQGVDGVWNDMNEPAVFKTHDLTMPEDNWHRGGGALEAFFKVAEAEDSEEVQTSHEQSGLNACDAPSTGATNSVAASLDSEDRFLPAGSHKLYHNVYGMLMTAATRKGISQADPSRRPFILTRANYLGGQRYAATWTGDNGSSMKYLKMSIPMTLNLGLSGQPLNGPDIGGYFGSVTADLFGKWISMAPFYPFSRAHTTVENPPREPWVFGEKIETVSRTALERRYRLMPYLYTLLFNACLNGDPIMQPLFFADPKDLRLRGEDEAFLLGSDLLVIPCWAKNPELPQGIWRELSLLDAPHLEKDGFQATLKIRGGSIIPLGAVIQNTNEPSLQPLTLLICLNEKGEATGSLYEDEGDGFGYLDGNYALTYYHAVSKENSVFIEIQRRSGKMNVPDRKIEVRIITKNKIWREEGSELRGLSVALDEH